MTVTATSGSSLSPGFEDAFRRRLSVPAASSLHIANDYLRGAASTIKDATDFTPGLFAGQCFGNEEKLSIRGSGLSQGFAVRGILMTYDGIPLTMADGFTDEELLDPAATQYVEIYRGGSALHYGAANLGGAINFVSPTGYTAPLFGARAELGSFDYYRAQGTHAQVLGSWDYYFSGSHFSEEGFRDHAARDLQRFNLNIGYRFREGAENRTYLIAGRGGKELAGGLTKTNAEQNPTLDTDLPPFNGVSPQTFFSISETSATPCCSPTKPL
ncbi:MAG: TonB-dependent receptor plug domain-containing protein [Gammaproteobacteria bacterium]